MARSSSNLKVMDETSFDQSWFLIGGGAFGQVWKTKHLQWGFNVAIKSLGLDNGLNSKDLVKEAEFMLRAAEGPYSMRVLGLFKGVVPRIGKVCVGLVMEMMERGSLTSLQEKLKHLPPWPLVFRLAHQLALGMNDLHCLEPALIHKDLKPDNILLDAGLNVKITDLGLAKFFDKVTGSRIKNYGTPPYMPPEALQGGAALAYDVYSYAMVLYSILHTGRAFPEFNNSKGERPSLEYVKGMTASGLEELVNLMVECWNQTAYQRPTFKECIAVTERLYEKHKNEICDAVHKVQQELDSVIPPEEETPSDLKDLRDMMKKMNAELQVQKNKMADMTVELRNASTELQLQKEKMDEMRVELRNELQLQKEMADMRVELRNASTELQHQKEKMAEMRVESRNELQLQKEKMVGVEKENAVINYRLANMELTVNPLTLKLAAMEPKLATLMEPKLATMEPKLAAMLAAMEPKLATLEPKLAAMESTVKPLASKLAAMEPKLAAMEPKLAAMEPKLAAMESTVKPLTFKLETMEITVKPKLATMEKMIADHGAWLSTVDTRLNVSEDKVQKLSMWAVLRQPQTRKDFLQYSSPLSLDLNTIDKSLSLSEGKRKVTLTRQQQPYPDHVDRFTNEWQVLCTEALSERHYWEVEWSGLGARIAVCYKDIARNTPFGYKDKSWSLEYSDKEYMFRHNSVETKVSGPVSSRVGVYLDHKAGTLSFYSVSDTITLLHTVQTTFTQPLYPGIRLGCYRDTAELCKTW